MAFIAGSIIGCLITAAIVGAYYLKRVKALEDNVNSLSFTISLQKNVIWGLRQTINIYKAKYGRLRFDDNSTDEEESECN